MNKNIMIVVLTFLLLVVFISHCNQTRYMNRVFKNLNDEPYSLGSEALK